MLCEGKTGRIRHVKDWESIADKLGKAGWSWRGVSTVDSDGGTIFVANAHRDSGKRSLNVRMKS
ncbi:MAG: hypothetical protein DME99_03215 [Verrucomicrobia bacterium]|nr:MAG: hypothetical protein DME99_03215 [Verrucomicrobiota bacterium]